MDDTILLPVGTVLGSQFTVEGVLGKPGGFGVVFTSRATRGSTRTSPSRSSSRACSPRAAPTA